MNKQPLQRNFMDHNNQLVARSWNGTPIQRRTTDGLAQTSEIGGLNPIETLDALSGSVGIPTDQLKGEEP